MARALAHDRTALAFDAITVEGALIAPAMLARIAQHQASGQSEADYGVPKGLTLREEIARYFRIGQALFTEFTASETPSTPRRSLSSKSSCTMSSALPKYAVSARAVGDRQFAVTLEGLGGRVPVVVVPPADDLDRPSDHLADRWAAALGRISPPRLAQCRRKALSGACA